MSQFDHERLEVYQVAMKFVGLSNQIAENLPRGKSYLTDQLNRATISIALNIAEGAGEFSKKEKARYYRIALRSATECAAILDICKYLELVKENLTTEGRTLLLRIVPMLTKMVNKLTESNST